jgi:hypothetical protein
MVVMATAASRAIPAVRIREHVGCRKKNAGCSPLPSRRTAGVSEEVEAAAYLSGG